jgi:hypothetical protein
VFKVYNPYTLQSLHTLHNYKTLHYVICRVLLGQLLTLIVLQLNTCCLCLTEYIVVSATFCECDVM